LATRAPYPPFNTVDTSSNFLDQVEVVEIAPTDRFFEVPKQLAIANPPVPNSAPTRMEIAWTVYSGRGCRRYRWHFGGGF
jgi:hypothetical protein